MQFQFLSRSYSWVLHVCKLEYVYQNGNSSVACLCSMIWGKRWLFNLLILVELLIVTVSFLKNLFYFSVLNFGISRVGPNIAWDMCLNKYKS